MKAFDERYELVTILGHPALFTSLRIERASVPERMRLYEVRHEDDNGMAAAQIGRGIMVNHMGTLLMRDALPLDEHGYLDIEDTDLVFTDSDIRELEEYMLRYPPYPKATDAALVEFTEQLLGYSEQEPVLFTSEMLDPITVPGKLQVLYAYEDTSENTASYGLRLFEAYKTIPAMPFTGTYVAAKREGSLLTTTNGEGSICYRELFTGREKKMSLKEYMQEQGITAAKGPLKNDVQER